MIINPLLPSGHTIFCDDIRHEIAGKKTFVGVYNGVLAYVGDAPIVLPQLCAAVTLRLDKPVEPVAVAVRILMTGRDEPLFEAKFDVQPPPPSIITPPSDDEEENPISFIQMALEAQFQGFEINGPCLIKVRAFIGEDEVRLGALKIISAPPVEQTDPAQVPNWLD